MSQAINFSDTTPAAPTGGVNLKWQQDGNGNISAYASKSDLTGTSVSTVFGRTGDIVAQSGDYTAAQITGAVSTAANYVDPNWITSLSWSKITGVPANVGAVSTVFGRSGAVVAQAGDYTAAQVTNAVSTAGSYADPAWITSLAYSKLSGSPSAAQIAAIQTPWLQNVSAAGFSLSNVPVVSAATSLTLAAGGPSSLVLQTSGAERMRVDSSGNVGIGTSSPSVLLHCSGGRAQVTQKAEAFGLGLQYNAATNGFWIGGTSDQALAFSDWGGIERVRITSAGSVGIGVSLPVAALDLAGSLRATGIIETENAFTLNLYYNGSAWVYRASNPAVQFGIDASTAFVACAPAGTAGANAPLLNHVTFLPSATAPATRFNFPVGVYLPIPGNTTYEAAIPNAGLMAALASNTSLVFRVRGTDGVMRQAALTLA